MISHDFKPKLPPNLLTSLVALCHLGMGFFNEKQRFFLDENLAKPRDCWENIEDIPQVHDIHSLKLTGHAVSRSL